MSAFACDCASGETDRILTWLPLRVGSSIRPCFLSIYTTLCNIGCTISACSFPKADPIRLLKSAILSAISVALAGVLSGLPSISLYNAFFIFVLISDNTKFPKSIDPA